MIPKMKIVTDGFTILYFYLNLWINLMLSLFRVKSVSPEFIENVFNTRYKKMG